MDTFELKPPRLVRSYAIPVDEAVFAGIPSVTALKPLPAMNLMLAAAMDHRVIGCDLASEIPAEDAGEDAAGLTGTHLNWSHGGWIHALDVHPDGRRVATGGVDRIVKLWRWGEDEPLAVCAGHEEWVRVLAFSPDAQLLASAGDDCMVRLWNVETAEQLATLDPETSYLDALAWSPDSTTLYAGGNDGLIHSWDVRQEKLIGSTDIGNRRNIEDETLNGGFSYPGGIRGMTCSPSGELLAAVGLTSLRVLNTADGGEVLSREGRGFGVAFHPSSRWLAFSQEKDIVFWDFESGQECQRVPANQLGLFDIAFFDDGRRLAAGGCNGRVDIWDLS